MLELLPSNDLPHLSNLLLSLLISHPYPLQRSIHLLALLLELPLILALIPPIQPLILILCLSSLLRHLLCLIHGFLIYQCIFSLLPILPFHHFLAFSCQPIKLRLELLLLIQDR